MSQEELAERVDISTTHMSHIETGNTKLSLPVLVSIAKALDARVDDILNESTACTALDEISAVLDRCTPQQANVIASTVKAVKLSMDKYL